MKQQNPETKEFEFYIEERLMIWNRLKFSVEAETLEEAKEKAKYMVTKEREDIEFWDNIMLYDTLTEMEIGDNEGNPTLELYCDKDAELIYDNANEDIKPINGFEKLYQDIAKANILTKL
jgi:hypothetical protein